MPKITAQLPLPYVCNIKFRKPESLFNFDAGFKLKLRYQNEKRNVTADWSYRSVWRLCL